MTTLTIKDLALASDLDRSAMTKVRGGTGKGLTSQYTPYMPSLSYSQSDFGFNASQMLGQQQNTQVNNGNNAAFVDCITANVNPTQTGTNNINFGHSA
ncbi:hypothetical protein [Noviherbaspirillum autotrophicum]|uniref:Uncharacterized protein n=1 Tax=Noviherbaspirillum autotrophicum TaxID=709839 RepID=A0A0C1YLQ7_9BURK|nr:hypothetical protein [Noviherbaspirillum autotrophicum]KIF81422.1 hypothetical protein TSA66_12340 [Noviherbaspirillum autotrophicum]